MKLRMQFCFMYISLKRVVKTYVSALLKYSLQRFLRALKRDKKKRKREERLLFIQLLCSPGPAPFLFLYETAARLTPLVDVAALHNQLPSPLERGSVATLPEENTNVRIFIFIHFFLYLYIERKRKKKGEEKRRRKKIPGAKTLRADFLTQNVHLFLYAFFF